MEQRIEESNIEFELKGLSRDLDNFEAEISCFLDEIHEEYLNRRIILYKVARFDSVIGHDRGSSPIFANFPNSTYDHKTRGLDAHWQKIEKEIDPGKTCFPLGGTQI